MRLHHFILSAVTMVTEPSQKISTNKTYIVLGDVSDVSARFDTLF